uniref:Uncharacterized protein n=1 Tax=Glossina austeni TaxID=7395 RepID=A0A1A9UPH3_GLOAU
MSRCKCNNIRVKLVPHHIRIRRMDAICAKLTNSSPSNEPKRSTFSLKLAEESSSFSVEDGFSTSDFNKHVSFIDLGTFVKDSNCLVKLPALSIFFAFSSRSTSIFGTLVASTCCSTSSPGLVIS